MRKAKKKVKAKTLAHKRKKYGPRLPKYEHLVKLPHKMLVLYAFNTVKLIPRWEKDVLAVNIAALVQSWLDGHGDITLINEYVDIYNKAEDLNLYRVSDIAIAFSYICDTILDDHAEESWLAYDSAHNATSYVLKYVPRSHKCRIRTKIAKNYRELRDFDKILEQYLLGTA